MESITIDLPPGSFTITSGRSTRPSSPATECCSSKSQYESIPAISITRLSWISPQRPRVCDSPRSALTRLPVCVLSPSLSEADDLELLVDLAVGALPLLLEQVDVRLDLLERLLQRLDEHAEPSHRLLGERVRVLAQRLRRESLDRGLDPGVECSSLGCKGPLRLGQRAVCFARLEGRLIAVGKRSAHGDEVDAGGADDEPDQECDDGHEGDER